MFRKFDTDLDGILNENQFINLIKDILDTLEKFSRSNDLKGFEIIKNVYLSKENFTVDNNLITTTMKLKRHIAKNHFMEQINKLYGKE